MTPFLQQVAKALLAEHGTSLRDVAIVLPSQRAGLYLRKWIAEEAGKPLWSPRIFTIGTFMEVLSGLRPLAPEELLFEGYEAYRKVEGDKAKGFGDFLQWAPTTLADISEADAHLVPLESYYRDLRSWEEIEWTFNDNPLSRSQQQMVNFWAMVGKLHAALNTRLLEQGAGTTGLIERSAVSRIGEGKSIWQAVWTIGLNALTPAQESVLRYFQSMGSVRFAWDADHYYLDRPEQEAGQHLRKAVGTFGPGFIAMGNNLVEGDLRLTLIRAPNDVSQAWCAAGLLKNASEDERARTAIVLADESLLQPLLEALPSDIGPINITMGLPVAQLPIGSFLDALHRLHAGMRPEAGFFHDDVERFLGHPFLRQRPMTAPQAPLSKATRGLHPAYIPARSLHDLFQGSEFFPEAAKVFTEVRDVRAGMPMVTVEALSWARRAMEGNDLASEQIYQASLVLRRIHLLLDRYTHELDLKAYSALFHRLLGSSRIGLFGEPLAGVQVMGMLEARALDPERLIVLGAQEGSLPTGGEGRSFIPFELRRAHGMPLREGNDAVQAYNFLRMLQRAREAVLIWPEGAEPAGPSRFILQLEHELFKGKEERMAVLDARIPSLQVHSAAIRVLKDEAVIKIMQERLAKGLSPSALGDWLRCPLDFHFKHVLKLKESEQFDVRIAPDLLGSALHGAMELVYEPFVGKPLEASALLAAAGRIEEMIVAGLKEKVGEEQLSHGQPLLQVRMAVHAAQRFLRNEAEVVQQGAVITPLELEGELSHELKMATEAIGSPVRMKGRFDRVDKRDGQVRILDLKSGKVDPQDLKVNELLLEALLGKRRYAAQLLVYAWLYLQERPDVDSVQAGILPLQRAASSEPLMMQLPGGPTVTREDLSGIEDLFTEAVIRMMDPSIPIVHDPQSKYCVFCLAKDA